MKIIKSFEDFNFVDNKPNVIWTWGLCDKGFIWFKCSIYDSPNHWYLLQKSPVINENITLQTMVSLVREFGHLLPLL